MAKKLFSEKKIKVLTQNEVVVYLSSKSITYSFEFKKRFIKEYKDKKLPK